jgi:type II secretory pathway pseudopilin PulG
LVEVLFALTVLSFSLSLIVALLGVGLSSNHDSTNRLQAADIASLLISTRRAAPTNANLTNFALPALGATNSAGQNVVTNQTNYCRVQTDGTSTSSSGIGSSQVVYNLRYMVTASGTQPKIANVDLVLWWPAALAPSASTMPANNPSDYYELMTQIALP